MRPRSRPPVVVPPAGSGVLIVLLGAAVLVIALLWFGALSYAYQRIGISPGWMILVLAAALLGSHVNLPLVTLRTPVDEPAQVPVRVFGVTYRLPVARPDGRTTVAVNVGGALVPGAVAGFLIAHDRLDPGTLLATLLVTAVVFAVARPVPGIGIVTPALLPPLAAAGSALVLGGPAVPAVAFVAGTFGTLVGADLLHLGRVRSLGARVVAIGGAGTFDGVFLTGLIAVLLATL